MEFLYLSDSICSILSYQLIGESADDWNDPAAPAHGFCHLQRLPKLLVVRMLKSDSPENNRKLPTGNHSQNGKFTERSSS